MRFIVKQQHMNENTFNHSTRPVGKCILDLVCAVQSTVKRKEKEGSKSQTEKMPIRNKIILNLRIFGHLIKDFLNNQS